MNQENQTLYLHIRDMDKAGAVIRGGGLVVFPTETVYGLGADALNEQAVRRIFKAKGRPADNPLIVHLSGQEAVEEVALKPLEEEIALFDAFSPGPLTLILNRKPVISDSVTGGLETVGVRIPSHPVAEKFLRAVGRPVAAPSANRSGRPSPTTFEMAVHEMDGRVAAVIDGGHSQVGLESTVVRVRERSVDLLRPGMITPEMIRNVLGNSYDITVRGCKIKDEEMNPVSPGMKYAHYQPEIPVYLADHEEIRSFLRRKFSEKTAVLLCEEDEEKLEPHGDNLKIYRFKTLEEYASSVYRLFYEIDHSDAKRIVAEIPSGHGIGLALRNRLERAGAGRRLNIWNETK